MMNNAEEMIAELEKQLSEQTVDAVDDAPQPSEPEPLEDAAEDIAEPKEEAKADETPDDDDIESAALSDDAKKRGAAFAKQRQEAKELKAQLEAQAKEKQALAERLARLEGFTEGRNPIPPAAENAEDKEPDEELYPEDWNKWQIRQLKKQIETISKSAKELAAERHYAKEQQGVQALENQFKEKSGASDYDDAIKFLADKEMRLKKILRPNASQAELQAELDQQKVQFFREIYKAGQQPAEVLYRLAKEDGWTPKSAQKQPSDRPRVNLDKVADNQRRAASLIGGSNATKAGTTITSDQLFSMSMSELTRLPDEAWEKALRSGAR